MSHPELAAEQAYVDHAYEQLERMRAVVAGAGDRVDGEVAQAAMDAWAAKRLRTFEDAEQGLCFGRLDFEEGLRPLYIGRRWVHDEEHRQLVVNWQAPAARPFYTATPIDPHGVTLRRRFRTDGRRLVDISDEALDGSILDGAAVGDFLLEELERGRERHMRDIVATIQADQYRLITAEPAPPLSSRAAPAPARRRSACTARRTCSTAIATRSRGGACSSSGRTAPSWSTSRTCCRRSARAQSSNARSESSSTGSSRRRRDPQAVAELKADLRLVEVIRRVGRAPARAPSRSSSSPGSRARSSPCASARCASTWRRPVTSSG